MLMRVALGIHLHDIDAAIETYNLMADKWFTHASPTMFNAGTPIPQMSSCFLLSMVRSRRSTQQHPASPSSTQQHTARHDMVAIAGLSGMPVPFSRERKPGHCRGEGLTHVISSLVAG